MFVATFVFLGLSIIAAVAWFCIPQKEPAEAGNPCVAQETKLSWDPNASWQDIKAAWLAEYVRREESETPRQTAARSWGRTFALCAVLCLIGVLLETQYNFRISIADIFTGSSHRRPASAPSHPPHFRSR